MARNDHVIITGKFLVVAGIKFTSTIKIAYNFIHTVYITKVRLHLQ